MYAPEITAGRADWRSPLSYQDNFLLLSEGLTVGTLVHSGVCLVGAHQDPVQGAVVLGVAVVGASLHGAFNALICMTVHRFFLLFV